MMLLCWRLDSASMESNLQMLCCQSIIKLEFSFVDWHTHTHRQTDTHIYVCKHWQSSLAYLVGKTQRAAVARERSQYFNVRQILLFTFVFRAETALAAAPHSALFTPPPPAAFPCLRLPASAHYMSGQQAAPPSPPARPLPTPTPATFTSRSWTALAAGFSACQLPTHRLGSGKTQAIATILFRCAAFRYVSFRFVWLWL